MNTMHCEDIVILKTQYFIVDMCMNSFIFSVNNAHTDQILWHWTARQKCISCIVSEITALFVMF